MPSNARNLANLLGSGETQISAAKLGNDVAPGTEDYSNVDSLGVGTTIGETAFVQGSNRMYIWNGSGWYNIALINTTPTWDSGGEPSASYTLDADSPQDATVITLAASDPEGLPISYTYVTSGSMDSMATISQDSSVFTITPKTVSEVGEGVELTGSITFRASDGVNILPSVSSFTLNFITIIENSKYTTLLVTATGTSDNNDITDSSTNNHTITVTGDAYAGTFSPYNDSYSAYMDGGDLYYLSSSADWNLGSNWTIEGWFYPTAQPTETCRLFMFGTNGGSAAMGIGLNSDMTWGGGGAFANGAMFNLPQAYLNQWQHVAWVRDGNSNTGTIYVNGVASAGSYSGPAVQAAGNVDLKIGYDTVGTVAYQYRGYFADIRITKSAVYTSNFTPATARLTSSDVLTDTKLLAFNKPYLKDQSTSNHNISISAGNPSFKVFAPFERLEYASSDNGGSVAMPNDNDYLYVPHSSTLKPSGTDPFCVSFWYFPTSSPGTTRQLAGDFQIVSYPANCNGWDILYQSGSQLDIRWGYPNYADLASGKTNSTVQINAWNHIVFCRSGGSLSYYLNGKRCNTTTSNIGISASGLTNFYVGYAGEASGTAMNSAMGTIADFKYEVGTSQFDATASTITVPTAPQSTTNSVLHIKGTDASIIDKSQGSNLKLVGNTTGSTTQVKFANTKSMYFDGAGDYITADQIPLGTGDFTIEAYTYLDSRLTNYPGIFSNYNTFSAGSLGLIAGHQSYTQTNYQVAHNGAGFPSINGGPITYDQWVHLCLERYNGTITLYKDGSSVGSFSSTVALNGVGSIFYIGALGDAISTSYINGWIQDFRVTTGLARYTANFTPPTAPLKG